MPRNEAAELEGQEFELILGNKQLLSVFFIVVILLGVFFTMGYVVGRNSAPIAAAQQTQSQPQTSDRQSGPSAVPIGERRPAPTAPLVSEPTPTPPAASPAKSEGAAQKSIELPLVVTVTQPQVGTTYLQVLAVAKPEAEVLADVLTKKGFRAVVAPGPNDRIFRVLVGPAKDPDDASKLKTDLEGAGFKPFFKKY
ncbi:MAG TPA: SPOR domain-containing protein [Bryobacteraceae bacterium]|nr:SPOR domain-containing protein [Bryobacteraceae bacterium]